MGLLQTTVDQVAAEARAGMLARRSIKKDAKLAGIKLAISMIDLTTLEGKDSPGRIRQLCQKAIRPYEDHGVPSVAAVCVYPPFVSVAKQALAGTAVKVASVATAFPSGQSPLVVKLADTRAAVEAGADEIDMVIDRGAFLSGEFQRVSDEIAAIKEACGAAHLKVILETGELETYDNIRKASCLAMQAGADFIKTSTGKYPIAATLPTVLVMLEAIRDYYYATGRMVGMKPAGGIRTSKLALQYLVLVNETLGDRWLTPEWFRLGASTVTNDLLMQLVKEATGRYQSEEYFSKD
ncbi:MAG: deoxyribose-phosphate aldolase [Deltaproteobacteria bacterium]|nr:deoxyribose-phosphate aldolase [Deltaproteobacteria bacterium]